MSRIRSTVTLLATVVLATTLGSCTGSGPAVSGAVVTHVRGLPPSVTQVAPESTKPVAAWAGPNQIYVVAYGSGSCPNLPTTVDADRHNGVVVKTHEQTFGAAACTADLGPTTSTVNLPRGIDDTKPVLVDIDGNITRLAPR